MLWALIRILYLDSFNYCTFTHISFLGIEEQSAVSSVVRVFYVHATSYKNSELERNSVSDL